MENISIVINALCIISFCLLKKYSKKYQKITTINVLLVSLPLSLAIVIKLYPAVLLCVLLIARKYKVFVFTSLLSIFWTLFAFLMFKNETIYYFKMLINNKAVSQASPVNLSLSVYIHSKPLLFAVLFVLFIYILFVCIKLYRNYNDDFIIVAIPLFFVFYALANTYSWDHHVALVFLICFLKVFENNKYNYFLLFGASFLLVFSFIEIIPFIQAGGHRRLLVFFIYVLIVPLVKFLNNKKLYR
jgi:hypothetical protein